MRTRRSSTEVCGCSAARPSSRISATRMRGLSDANGSWKMICTERRASRSAGPCRSNRLRPSSSADPLISAWPRSSCTMALPAVVLPQPDSPTSANVWPAAMLKDSWLTASKRGAWRAKTRLGNEKLTQRSLTCSSGVAPPLAATAVTVAAGAETATRPKPGPPVASSRQRTWRPGSPVSAGAVTWQADCAWTQRGAKRQPVKSCVSGGTVPGIAAKAWSRRPAPGSACISARA